MTRKIPLFGATPLFAVLTIALWTDSVCVGASAASQANSPDLASSLIWMEDNGGALRPSVEHAPHPSRAPNSYVQVKKSDSNGNIVAVPLRKLHAHTFRGPTRYVADLPASSNSEGTFIGVNIAASAAADPRDGTVVDINGAILGFKLVYGDKGDEIFKTEKHSSRLARLVVLQPMNDGKEWRETSVNFQIDPTTGSLPPVKLSAKISQAHHNWDLYYRNVVILSGLTLMSANQHPSISVAPGIAPRTAVLKDVSVGDRPLKGQPIPAENDHMALDKALAAHDPHAKRYDVSK